MQGLAFWAAELGLNQEIRFAGYGQLFQQLLDPASLFARNRGGFNIALVRFEDWREAGVEDSVARFSDAVRSAAAAFASPLIVVVCPPTPANQPAFAALEGALSAAIADLPGVHIIPAEEIHARYPVAEVHDPLGADLGHLPYTPVFFAALATAVARRIHAIVTPPRKVIVLDCDDTLWKGICGEDGPQGIVIDPPHRALQRFMAERRHAGYLLALCSKNNEDDVLEVFRAHPGMPLGIGDFVARRIDWEPKSANLASLADELGLGLDSFILVDDSAKECTEVQAALPEVLALPLPSDPAGIPAMLSHVWAFDRARVTDEDRRRPELYAQRAERVRAERSAASLEEFLASLDLRIRIAPLEPADLPRVAQLTARTSQMNTTCQRRSEAEIGALCETEGWECLTVSVRDRFGDYGLTGVAIFRAVDDALTVDTFLLSCRALGRGVEHRMVARLGEIAQERQLAAVRIPFAASARNQPAWLFLRSMASPDSHGAFSLSADAAAQLRYRPAAVSGAAKPLANAHGSERSHDRQGVVSTNGTSSEGQRPSERAIAAAVDYLKIATRLRDPEAVLAQIRATAQPRADGTRRLDPPRTPVEQELAGLWAGLLNVPAVGIHENFFELGGHSLLAVQLLSRVRQVLGVELSLEVVYSGEFTVAELAKAVELKEIEQAGGNYQELLSELEGLSDEEVRALLAEEGS
jgi:FkbH-like protein